MKGSLRDDGGFLERYNDDDNDNARYSHIPGERKGGEEGRGDAARSFHHRYQLRCSDLAVMLNCAFGFTSGPQ